MHAQCTPNAPSTADDATRATVLSRSAQGQVHDALLVPARVHVLHLLLPPRLLDRGRGDVGRDRRLVLGPHARGGRDPRARRLHARRAQAGASTPLPCTPLRVPLLPLPPGAYAPLPPLLRPAVLPRRLEPARPAHLPLHRRRGGGARAHVRPRALVRGRRAPRRLRDGLRAAAERRRVGRGRRARLHAAQHVRSYPSRSTPLFRVVMHMPSLWVLMPLLSPQVRDRRDPRLHPRAAGASAPPPMHTAPGASAPPHPPSRCSCPSPSPPASCSSSSTSRPSACSPSCWAR